MVRTAFTLLFVPLVALSAPVLPQTRADAELLLTTMLEGVPYVDGDGTAYFSQGCVLRDGTQTPQPTFRGPLDRALTDPSGKGYYGYEWEFSGSSNSAVLKLYRNTCDAPPTFEGSTSFPEDPSSNVVREPLFVDENRRLCLETNEGLSCFALPSGALTTVASVDQLRGLMPPIATLRARDPETIPADASYGGVRILSAVRSAKHARTFMIVQVEVKRPLLFNAPVLALSVVELSGSGLRLVDGPDFGTVGRARGVEKLFLDEGHGLVFASGGLATHAMPFLGSDGERYPVPPAMNVYPADGSPGVGFFNWATLMQGLRRDVAVGAPLPKLFATFAGPLIFKEKPNPRAERGTLLYRFTIDWERIDFDEDGLPADRERALGTSNLREDSDGGGISDSFEVARGTNPLLASDDAPGKGTLPEHVDYSVSTLVGDVLHAKRYYIAGGLRPGRLFCSTGACLEQMRARFDDMQARVLTLDAKGVIGFVGQRFIVRSFDGSERQLDTLPSTGLIVPLTGSILLFREGLVTQYLADGSKRTFDLDLLVCETRVCTADTGSVPMSIIGLDRETETLRLAGRGNEEIFTFTWHPDRGIALVGRNTLMPFSGKGQIQSCQFTPEGACLAVWLVSSGNSFPGIVHGQTGAFWLPFRMLTNGYPQNVAWDTSFTGFALLDTGRIVETEWVRMEDRIEPGDVLTMETGMRGETPRVARLYRIGKRGAMLPLYGDSYDPEPDARGRLEGLPRARGLGVSTDGRICLVGVDGSYRELAEPDARGLPQKVGVATDVKDAVDCGFDATGRAHVLATNPPRLILLDSRAPSPILETIPLTPTGGAPSQLTVGPGGEDVIAQTAGPFLCLNVASKVARSSQVTGVAAAVDATYGAFILDDRYNATRLKGSVCDAKPFENVTLGTQDVGPSSFFDLVVRPDGRLVAQGSRQVLVTSTGGLHDTTIQSRAVTGPVALVPGGTWTDPWAESLFEPDFTAKSDPGVGPGDGGTPPPEKGCGCGGAPGSLLPLAVLGLLAWGTRRRARV